MDKVAKAGSSQEGLVRTTNLDESAIVSRVADHNK